MKRRNITIVGRKCRSNLGILPRVAFDGKER